MSGFFLCVSTLLAVLGGGCSTEAAKPHAETVRQPISGANSAGSSSAPAASIQITAGSPADTVRAFYTKLREKKFREAIFLTNLRPAIEGLTDAELKDFQVDFEAIANKIPAEVTINGEIVSGEKATVTASLPGEEGHRRGGSSTGSCRSTGRTP